MKTNKRILLDRFRLISIGKDLVLLVPFVRLNNYIFSLLIEVVRHLILIKENFFHRNRNRMSTDESHLRFLSLSKNGINSRNCFGIVLFNGDRVKYRISLNKHSNR